MKILITGTGYVGLVTGIAFANFGFDVTCYDIDKDKIQLLKNDKCPIYEKDLEKYMIKCKNNIIYTTDFKNSFKNPDVIFICVGTPENNDGSANLKFVYEICDKIIENVNNDCVVVIKSTVPIGTNDIIEKFIQDRIKNKIKIYVVSNPEFLSQGTALKNTLNASRIIIGANEKYAKDIMLKIYKPFTKNPYNVPIITMDRKSAEMVKYASNDFLALKISYINEISNFCELVGANIEDVTLGMSYDDRIGKKFLNSGIGYGGSCFPKDTKALHWLSKDYNSELKTIKACIDVNKKQKTKIFDKFNKYFKKINNRNVAILGLTFKPETDDIREAPSIDNIKLLLKNNCKITVFDPVGINNIKKIFKDKINYASSIKECIKNKEAVFIMTEWEIIKNLDINFFIKHMKFPIIFDGRNCFDLLLVKKYKVDYISMGRENIFNLNKNKEI